ncbi:hypothetical protein TYRP_013925, partial [Tyrophagus putrescentiae]
MEGGTDENLSFAGYFWQFRAVFSYCTVQKTNFVINLKTRTLCQIKNMRFWSYAIHISTFLAYLSLRFTAENSSLQFVRSIACTAANDDDNDGKWNIYCSKPSSPLQNKFVMYLFVDRQNENVKIVQNGKVLDKTETESIVLYRKRATKFNQIAISILYSSLVAFFLANMFSNWRGTLYDYLTWPITLLASIYLPITNFFMIFFFLMVVRYIRIKQQCIKVKVVKILKKNQADFSTLKTTSGISHSRQTSFKRINAKMLSIYEEIKGQNQYWSKFITIYFAVYIMEICYLSYAFFFVPISEITFSKYFFGFFSAELAGGPAGQKPAYYFASLSPNTVIVYAFLSSARIKAARDLRAKRAGPEETEVDSGQVTSEIDGKINPMVPRAKRAGPEETDVDTGQVTQQLHSRPPLLWLAKLFTLLLLYVTLECSRVVSLNVQMHRDCLKMALEYTRKAGNSGVVLGGNSRSKRKVRLLAELLQLDNMAANSQNVNRICFKWTNNYRINSQMFEL